MPSRRPSGYQRYLVTGLACKLYRAGLVTKPMLDRISAELPSMTRQEVIAIYEILRQADGQTGTYDRR